jgi:hypothetical protein
MLDLRLHGKRDGEIPLGLIRWKILHDPYVVYPPKMISLTMRTTRFVNIVVQAHEGVPVSLDTGRKFATRSRAFDN